VHDPSIIKQGDTYYLFTTSQENEPPGLIHIRTSKDLVTWRRAGAVFQAIPAWAKSEIGGTKGIWAPDISFSNGEYRLYYAVSTFGSNHSAIGLATTPTLDPAAPGYGWTDHGAVLISHHNDDYNAIDPNAFTDRDGKQWLAFGSFWSGIKLIALDPVTGKPSAEDKKVHPLLERRAPDAAEAPFLIDHGGYYYLFASYDFCCRGVKSTYYTVVGRSKDVTGPYVDYDGKSLMDDHGQIVLHADLDKTGRFKGPGGGSILQDGGQDYIVYHAYDAKNGGAPTLRIQRLGWTADGWPVAIQ
jgi:arabinan endo-1,5-alpha-L-arabinosidase